MELRLTDLECGARGCERITSGRFAQKIRMLVARFLKSYSRVSRNGLCIAMCLIRTKPPWNWCRNSLSKSNALWLECFWGTQSFRTNRYNILESQIRRWVERY